MNRAVLVGRLAADPEYRTTQAGNAQTSFRIAVDRMPNKEGVREADFIPVVLFKQQAEFAAKYLTKGDRVAVEGSIRVRSYDAQDGSKRYVTEVWCERVEALRDRREASESTPARVEPQRQPQRPVQTSFRELPVDDDELPF